MPNTDEMALYAEDVLVHHRGFAVKETPKSGGFLKFVPVFFFSFSLLFRDLTLFYAALFSSLMKRIINI